MVSACSVSRAFTGVEGGHVCARLSIHTRPCTFEMGDKRPVMSKQGLVSAILYAFLSVELFHTQSKRETRRVW